MSAVAQYLDVVPGHVAVPRETQVWPSLNGLNVEDI